jgi:hypothetical protein
MHNSGHGGKQTRPLCTPTISQPIDRRRTSAEHPLLNQKLVFDYFRLISGNTILVTSCEAKDK